MQWPSLLSHIRSFVMLGIYWVALHNMFHYIKRSDRPFLWINILLLMCVDPEERPVRAFDVVKHIVVGDPVDANDHKAQYVAQETGPLPEELIAQVAVQFR